MKSLVGVIKYHLDSQKLFVVKIANSLTELHYSGAFPGFASGLIGKEVVIWVGSSKRIHEIEIVGQSQEILWELSGNKESFIFTGVEDFKGSTKTLIVSILRGEIKFLLKSEAMERYQQVEPLLDVFEKNDFLWIYKHGSDELKLLLKELEYIAPDFFVGIDTETGELLPSPRIDFSEVSQLDEITVSFGKVERAYLAGFREEDQHGK